MGLQLYCEEENEQWREHTDGPLYREEVIVGGLIADHHRILGVSPRQP